MSENQATLGALGAQGKVFVSIFESLSGRTAGFSTVGWGAGDAGDHTKLLFSGLMIVGGASGSAAGGIRVNTVAVVAVSVLSTLRGHRQPVAFAREIGQDQMQRAMTISATAVFFVFLVALSLTFTEAGATFIDRLFESVSAFGTVGLSVGLTETLVGRRALDTGGCHVHRDGDRALHLRHSDDPSQEGPAVPLRAGASYHRLAILNTCCYGSPSQPSLPRKRESRGRDGFPPSRKRRSRLLMVMTIWLPARIENTIGCICSDFVWESSW